jgi:catechol 2,3-dioxygenase-like lactoylglutathione lyase family enzyme
MTAFVRTPTPDLAASVRFYTSLGFVELGSGDGRTLLHDGTIAIEIVGHRHARTGIALPGAKLPNLIDTDAGRVTADPNGVRIYEAAPIAFTPGAPAGVLGKLAGLCIETADVARSVAFWTELGYRATATPSEGFAMLAADNGLDINLMRLGMCPHLFPNPGITYFNGGNNPVVIENIRAAGVAITQGIDWFSKTGAVDNVIVIDPGGTGFFVFND